LLITDYPDLDKSVKMVQWFVHFGQNHARRNDYRFARTGASMTAENLLELKKAEQPEQVLMPEDVLRSDFEKTALMLAEKLDFLDAQILRKFYITGREFPFDTQPFCFPILYKEMKDSHRLKMCREALRKRLDNLVKTGFLEKVRGSNPINYEPSRGKENLVRAVITKFFLIHGLTKFM